MTAQPQAADRRVATNRKARYDYHVLDSFEAGIELRGTEVKAVRDGQINLAGGYAAIRDGQIMLHSVNIAPYQFGNQFNHDPLRPRRLLLHRKEIDRLAGHLARKGSTLVPLSCYFSRRGKIKIELGLCRGKQDPDKREALRRKMSDDEARRAMSRH